MEQTLEPGDRILVKSPRLCRRGRQYPRHRRHRRVRRGHGVEPATTGETNPLLVALRWVGEVTGFGPSSAHTLVKRVIGTPGDTVACCTNAGEVAVDQQPLDEPSRTTCPSPRAPSTARPPLALRAVSTRDRSGTLLSRARRQSSGVSRLGDHVPSARRGGRLLALGDGHRHHRQSGRGPLADLALVGLEERRRAAPGATELRSALSDRFAPATRGKQGHRLRRHPATPAPAATSSMTASVVRHFPLPSACQMVAAEPSSASGDSRKPARASATTRSSPPTQATSSRIRHHCWGPRTPAATSSPSAVSTSASASPSGRPYTASAAAVRSETEAVRAGPACRPLLPLEPSGTAWRRFSTRESDRERDRPLRDGLLHEVGDSSPPRGRS